MAKHLYRLQRMHINAEHNLVHNEHDWDVVTFGVEVGPAQCGPRRTTVHIRAIPAISHFDRSSVRRRTRA